MHFCLYSFREDCNEAVSQLDRHESIPCADSSTVLVEVGLVHRPRSCLETTSPSNHSIYLQ